MFWGLILFAGFAFIFAKLGALSVWVSILKLGLTLALLILVIIGIVFLWRRVFPAKRLNQLNQKDGW